MSPALNHQQSKSQNCQDWKADGTTCKQNLTFKHSLGVNIVVKKSFSTHAQTIIVKI